MSQYHSEPALDILPALKCEAFSLYFGKNTMSPSVDSSVSSSKMGAAGFEPATTWSEAKHSIQTELSALQSTVPA